MSGISAATVATYASIATAAIGAYSAYAQGEAAKNAADFEAKQMERNASEARAVAQREAVEQRRRATLAQSRALAVAAASGAGALDNTLVDLIGDIGAEGDLNSRSALYSGESRGAGMEASASARRYEGKQAQRAGQMKAFSTLLSSGSSLYSNFGGGASLSTPGYSSSDLGSGLKIGSGGGIRYSGNNW